MGAEGRVSEKPRLCGEDRGGTTKLGVYLLLACNRRILVVCFFGVRAREADRRAGLTLRGVCRERGWLVCDTFFFFFFF